MSLIPIIGLEVHAQLKTASKMFCACGNVEDGAPPNSAICPVCTGQPGALPTLNGRAIELGVKTGLALGCQIPNTAVFDRKNYFYPDLPKGYQISQFHLPIATNGHLVLDIPNATDPARSRIRIGVTRAHLEEDAAKNMHTTEGTVVDFNRAGTPLLEIVSDPDLRSPQEAKIYLQELRGILRCIGASDAEMEKGQMRCDANISLLEVGKDGVPLSQELNPKIEVKNLNSFRAVERALTHEIARQTELHEAGTPPTGATRGWDEHKGVTFEQRSKESSADYRYFPEPDLPPQDLVALRERLSLEGIELPAETRTRLAEEWGFGSSDIAFFVANDGWTEYAEHVMSELGEWLDEANATDPGRKQALAKLAGGWLTSKLAGLLAERNATISDLKITPEDFAEFLQLIDGQKINSANAMRLLVLMIDSGTDPSHLMEEHDLGQTMDHDTLSAIIKRIVEENPDQVAQIKAGKVTVIKWFVGAIMKATEGKANPAQAEEMVKEVVGGRL